MPVWLIVLIGCLIVTVTSFYIMTHGTKLLNKLKYSTRENLGVMFMVLTVIFGCCTVLGPIVVGELEHNYDYVEYENIYSVRGTNDDVDGSFFLGSGHIDENSYYIVFVEDEKGIRMNKYDTRFTYIVEVDDGNHYVRRVKEKWDWCDCYYLYVPVGTIIVEYRI